MINQLQNLYLKKIIVFRLSLLFIFIDNQNNNYFSISLKRIINQSKIVFSLHRNCYSDIIIKKLYYRSIWRYRKSKNFYISEITFFHNIFPTYCLSQTLSSLSSILSNLNAKYFFSVYTPSWQPFKMKFPKKVCITQCMKFASSPRTTNFKKYHSA